MRHQHKLLEVEHLRVEFEIICNAVMYHVVPLFSVILALHCVITDPIPPLVLRIVEDESSLNFRKPSLLCDFIVGVF